MSELEKNEHFKMLMNLLFQEINSAYSKIIAGSKEDFDYNKGRFMGLNFIPTYIKQQKDKLKGFTKIK